ncbi:MAG TPA: histidine kinase [Terriglobales bacterium]|nr:histidine kinase [Terriglobales bacterium]
MDQRLILVSLLLKLGVAAAVASALARSRYFQSLLFREERTTEQKVHLVLFIAVPLALGVIIRGQVRNFLAADLSLEGAILMGVMGGRFAGAVGGALVALPALIYGEFLAVPFAMAAGGVAGVLRRLAANYEEIWSFSPFVDLGVYRWVRRVLRRRFVDWQTGFFLWVLGMELARTQLAHLFPGRLFALQPTQWLPLLATLATTVAVVAIPLKIWNNTRIELKLEEQEKLLLQARMEALQTQINPHFLFNTLNSVSSLVRFDPEQARELIVKLASILRRLLRKSDSFVQLREEVEFIDDYLDIEVVRFGRDKLRVIKELDPASLEVLVPAMLLQPLVENSIKHGLSPKVEGGSIILRSRVAGGKVVVQVADDGVGMADPAAPIGSSSGIGMSNVAERLQVLYGDAAVMRVENRETGGTEITLEVPILQVADLGPETNSVAAAAYEARSSTQR